MGLITEVFNLKKKKLYFCFIPIQNQLTIAGCEQENPYLHSMNSCLRDLLSLWFSVGFLHLQRITWQCPCDMLQKVA